MNGQSVNRRFAAYVSPRVAFANEARGVQHPATDRPVAGHAKRLNPAKLSLIGRSVCRARSSLTEAAQPITGRGVRYKLNARGSTASIAKQLTGGA